MLRARGYLAAVGCSVAILAMWACGSNNGNASGMGFDDGGFGDSPGITDDGPSPSTDGNSGSSSGGGSGGGDGGDAGDSASDAGLAATGAIIVHASPQLPDLRLCWSTTQNAASGMNTAFPSANPAPYTNYPAVPVGGLAPLADASSMVGTNLTFTGYPAADLIGAPSECSCDRLVNNLGSCNTYTSHHIDFQPVPGLTPGATSLVVVTGCLPNGPGGERCGAGWHPGTGNLKIQVQKLPPDPASFPDGGMQTVGAQVSPSVAYVLGDGGATIWYGGPDGGTPLGTLPGLGVGAVTTLHLPTKPTQYGQTGFGVNLGSAAAPLWMSLLESLDRIDPMQDPTQYYATPATFVVAVIGDPMAPRAFGPGADASYDGTQLHLMVVPLP